METLLQDPDDHYEPPPHIFARAFRPVIAAVRRFGWLPIEWRWKWRPVQIVFFETLAYLAFTPTIAKHLTPRFRADPRGQFYHYQYLLYTARSGWNDFLQYLARYEFYAAVFAPLCEELLFRGLPILLARWFLAKFPTSWGRSAAATIAIAATLYFAWGHNPYWGNLPLLQLIFGIAAWLTAWRWGLRYSILLHASINLGATLIPAIEVWRRTHP